MDESAAWLLSWKILGPDDKVLNSKFKFVDGWLQDIAGVKLLVNELCNSQGFAYLCTRRLCSDPLENLVRILLLNYSKRSFNAINFVHSLLKLK